MKKLGDYAFQAMFVAWLAMIAAFVSAIVTATKAHALDYASACADGCVGCCMIHRIQILFAMLGGWN